MADRRRESGRRHAGGSARRARARGQIRRGGVRGGVRRRGARGSVRDFGGRDQGHVGHDLVSRMHSGVGVLVETGRHRGGVRRRAARLRRRISGALPAGQSGHAGIFSRPDDLLLTHRGRAELRADQSRVSAAGASGQRHQRHATCSGVSRLHDGSRMAAGRCSRGRRTFHGRPATGRNVRGGVISPGCSPIIDGGEPHRPLLMRPAPTPPACRADRSGPERNSKRAAAPKDFLLS